MDCVWFAAIAVFMNQCPKHLSLPNKLYRLKHINAYKTFRYPLSTSFPVFNRGSGHDPNNCIL